MLSPSILSSWLPLISGRQLITHPFLGKALFPVHEWLQDFYIRRLRGSDFDIRACQKTCLQSVLAKQVLCFYLVLVYLGESGTVGVLMSSCIILKPHDFLLCQLRSLLHPSPHCSMGVYLSSFIVLGGHHRVRPERDWGIGPPPTPGPFKPGCFWQFCVPLRPQLLSRNLLLKWALTESQWLQIPLILFYPRFLRTRCRYTNKCNNIV